MHRCFPRFETHSESRCRNSRKAFLAHNSERRYAKLSASFAIPIRFSGVIH